MTIRWVLRTERAGVLTFDCGRRRGPRQRRDVVADGLGHRRRQPIDLLLQLADTLDLKIDDRAIALNLNLESAQADDDCRIFAACDRASNGWKSRPRAPSRFAAAKSLGQWLYRINTREPSDLASELLMLAQTSNHQPRIIDSTSSRLRSICSAVVPSRFNRRSGSVFEGRTLKCQSGYSMEMPSSFEMFASG